MGETLTIDRAEAEAAADAAAADLIHIADDIDARCRQIEQMPPSCPDPEEPGSADMLRKYRELVVISLRLDALGLRRLADAIPEPEYLRRHEELGAMAGKIGATLGGQLQ
ncbi:hypothetical protein DYI37_11525 [Fulvimarina endophytica]|uniref:Uncharacterized protein n=1 Tax=Fulvimarina endophytica TaxID=2293836 RepID=A0A371X327_9HYPH|nr:hypothetical protein [Fulvimarina endophytica]RFC63627.1 hypothetical protein DYI37_11525 [Fulvimarina endophytica]